MGFPRPYRDFAAYTGRVIHRHHAPRPDGHRPLGGTPRQMERAREAALINTDPDRVPPLALPPNPENAILGSLTGDEFTRVAAEGARTAPPRENGGNQDIKNLTRGTRVFYPVYVPGANFSVGDRKSTRLNSSHVAISYAV